MSVNRLKFISSNWNDEVGKNLTQNANINIETINRQVDILDSKVAKIYDILRVQYVYEEKYDIIEALKYKEEQ